MKLRGRWQKLAGRARMHGRKLGWASACAAIESASARQIDQARRRVRVATNRRRATRNVVSPDANQGRSAQATLEPGQRRTLEVGSCVVLSGLGLGYQLGGWPSWSIVAAAGVYAGWVVLYAEVTIQARRRPGLWQRWPWRPPPRSYGRAAGHTSAPASQPAQEQRAT
jgi:hypothetical protein